MYQRLFLYSRNQIAIKNINILLDPALSAKKSYNFLRSLPRILFQISWSGDVNGRGRGSCLKTEKQCNWTSNFLKLFDSVFCSTRIWKSRTPPIVPRRIWKPSILTQQQVVSLSVKLRWSSRIVIADPLVTKVLGIKKRITNFNERYLILNPSELLWRFKS